MNAYLQALAQIPAGETRTFMELAAMAGRPGAARAAGRAIASCPPTSKLPWHRVVPASGVPRRELQLRRLRREGARPRSRESIEEWAKRIHAVFIGDYGSRAFVKRGDARARGWNPEQVEAFTDESFALARGFLPPDANQRREEPLPEPRPVPAERRVCPIGERIRQIPWDAVHAGLERHGVYRLEKLLAPSECVSILNASGSRDRFERSIDMLAKGYGVGAYHYYKEPLPQPAAELREELYRNLRGSDNPTEIAGFWELCRRAGQERASSILIGYGKGGINHPHRDIYGRVFFPYQALIVLSRRGLDFEGGEFYVADENEPGSATVVAVDEGDVVIFASRERREGGRRIPLRHGMTRVTRGRRYGLGLVFHLAE